MLPFGTGRISDRTREAPMPDDPLLPRLRAALAGAHPREQKMFGGVCFMVDGNMVAGTSKRGLLVRVGKEGHAAALRQPHTRAMEMGGRTMEGYVFVEREGTASDEDLRSWLKLARSYVATLPPKTKGASSKKTRSKR
jgi:TfoX/Sxy family transcriptional regulator of competence genes